MMSLSIEDDDPVQLQKHLWLLGCIDLFSATAEMGQNLLQTPKKSNFRVSSKNHCNAIFGIVRVLMTPFGLSRLQLLTQQELLGDDLL